MNIPLKKQHADWIAEQVRRGRYASELEAIEDALAARIEEDEIERLRARLEESIAQVDRDEVISADDAYFDEKRRMIRERYLKSA